MTPQGKRIRISTPKRGPDVVGYHEVVQNISFRDPVATIRTNRNTHHSTELRGNGSHGLSVVQKCAWGPTASQDQRRGLNLAPPNQWWPYRIRGSCLWIIGANNDHNLQTGRISNYGETEIQNAHHTTVPNVESLSITTRQSHPNSNFLPTVQSRVSPYS